jgi:hypothetical protein
LGKGAGENDREGEVKPMKQNPSLLLRLFEGIEMDLSPACQLTGRRLKTKKSLKKIIRIKLY